MKELTTDSLSFNPFDKIGKEWCLITAGNEDKWNTMTASWGFMGVMWGKNCIQPVVRHSRYTFEFMEKEKFFTVSFFDEKYRKALSFCGSHSGRDTDKAKETGLTPFFTDGTVSFEEASLIFVCRKMFSQDILLENICPEQHHWYENDAIHKAYIGEIVKVYGNS